MLLNYIFKILIEIVLLPLTYKVVKYLKTREEVDHLDTDTNFNPVATK